MPPKPPPPPELTEDEILFDSFKALLLELSRLEKDTFESSLNLAYPGASFASPIKNCLIRISEISHNAKMLLHNQDKIFSVDTWKMDYDLIRTNCFILDNPNHTISEFYSAATTISGSLNGLDSQLPPARRFDNAPLSTDIAEVAEVVLQEFISNGKTIVSSPGYEGSKLDKLDQLLFDTDTVTRNDFQQETNPTLVTAKSFVALAAPSLEGKTQSAFTLRRGKPLYFPVSPVSGRGSNTTQSIYNNFLAHAFMLKKCAELDLQMIGKPTITAELLKENFTSAKFWTLGFLKKIVDDAITVFGPQTPATADEATENTLNNPVTENPAPEHAVPETNPLPELPWMRYYAKMESFSFDRASIASIPAGHFKGFCVFLDEYTKEDWAIFVRNLVRALEIKCVCSNTNTIIANLVGVGSESGGGESNIWSFVIKNLNSPCVELLNEKFNLDNCITIIKNRARSSSLRNFLTNFRRVQLPNLRPGVAVYAAKALKRYAEHLLANENLTVTLGDMMDSVITQLSTDLSTRKPKLLNDSEAAYAKISLLFSDSYYNTRPIIEEEDDEEDDEDEQIQEWPRHALIDLNPEQVENNDSDVEMIWETEEPGFVEEVEVEAENGSSFCNQSKFLEDHLFYLHNPHDRDKWIFLTFSPEESASDKSLLIQKSDCYESWSEQTTHFEPSELFTLLGCLFIRSSIPITRILEIAKRTTNRKSSAVYDKPNEHALQFPGNPLEVSAAVSVVDATQHSFEPREYFVSSFSTGNELKMFTRTNSFAGQKGNTFIRNLIVNLITDPNFTLNFSSANNVVLRGLASIEFHSSPQFNLEGDFLSKLHVPFLYSIDRPVDLLDKYSRYSSGFFLDILTRTENAEQIDGKFTSIFDGWYRNIVLECKNRKDNIGTDMLKKILKKVLKRNDPIMSLIFGPSFVDPSADSRDCREFCVKAKINVYRILNLSSFPDMIFKVVPYFGNESICGNPNHICILLESLKINPPRR